MDREAIYSLNTVLNVGMGNVSGKVDYYNFGQVCYLTAAWLQVQF